MRNLYRLIKPAFITMLLLMAGGVNAADPSVETVSGSRVGAKMEEPTDPVLIKALRKKTLETERLRKKVKELEALLRMKTEISKAKSRAIEELEAAKNKK